MPQPSQICNQWPLSWDVWRQSLVKFAARSRRKRLCLWTSRTASEILHCRRLFLLDPGLFDRSRSTMKLTALARMLEASLQAPIIHLLFVWELTTQRTKSWRQFRIICLQLFNYSTCFQPFLFRERSSPVPPRSFHQQPSWLHHDRQIFLRLDYMLIWIIKSTQPCPTPSYVS